MIKFLVLQVKMGKITLEQIPERYREEVKTAIKDGFIDTDAQYVKAAKILLGEAE